MPPLDALDQSWRWYEAARLSLRRLEHLTKYWDHLPWKSGPVMERDNVIGKLEGTKAAEDAAGALARLADLAVVELFSVFEGVVRALVAEQVRAASLGLSHPMLKAAAKGAVEAAERRSFAEILRSYSQGGHADLTEQVRQIRRYRNWLSHGRRGKPLRQIEPKTAYQRLRLFLELLLPKPPATPPAVPDAIP
jgi:hypothetical protein